MAKLRPTSGRPRRYKPRRRVEKLLSASLLVSTLLFLSSLPVIAGDSELIWQSMSKQKLEIFKTYARATILGGPDQQSQPMALWLKRRLPVTISRIGRGFADFSSRKASPLMAL